MTGEGWGWGGGAKRGGEMRKRAGTEGMRKRENVRGGGGGGEGENLNIKMYPGLWDEDVSVVQGAPKILSVRDKKKIKKKKKKKKRKQHSPIPFHTENAHCDSLWEITGISYGS